jgi:cell division protein FtsI/penicillin-binding protein 2
LDLTRVDNEWKVAWRSESIIPELSDENKLLLAPVVPTRANIYDREGFALATQSDTVALYLVPNEIPKDAEAGMLSTLSRLLDLPQENILSRYDDIRQYNWYVHLGEVSLSEFQPYENALLNAEAVYWQTYPSRYYFSEGLAPHSINIGGRG